MPNLTIKCPCCHEEFPLSSKHLASVRAELSHELTAQVQKRENDLEKEVATLKKQRNTLEQERSSMQQKISQEVAEKVQAQELSIKEEVKKMQAEKAAFLTEQASFREKVDEMVSATLKEKESVIQKKAEEKAQEQATQTLKEKEALLAEKESALKEAKQKEITFLQKERLLEEKANDIELTVARKLKEETGKIAAAAREKAEEEHRLKVAEKDKVITDMSKKLQDAQRKAEQGSQQGQGEVLELHLEEHLRSTYPQDTVSAIKTGANGADISLFIESTEASAGKHLLFELKNTLNWQPKWVSKLKDDMQSCHANQGIIITRALPPHIQGFGIHEGVWVSDFQSAKSLIPTLRAYLLEVHRARNLQQGAKEKAQELYDYITSDAFRQRVFQINSHFKMLREDMAAERAYLEKKWASREAHIQQILGNLNGITGTTEALTHSPLNVVEQATHIDEEPESVKGETDSLFG